MRRATCSTLLALGAIAFGVPAAGQSLSDGDRAALAERVRSAARFAWHAYEEHAWGDDELQPLSAKGRNWYDGKSLLMTPVDALDTLLLLGLDDEAARAKALIVARLSFDQDVSVKNFEITIRLLGGLLSSYQLTGDRRLLALAEDLGNRLLPAFDSPTGMPFMFVNLKTGRTSGRISNPAEIGTLILEFGTLAKLTGRAEFFDKPKRALLALAARRSRLGLVGEEIDVVTGRWKSHASHVGGGIDSYYEYLLKCSLLFGDADCARLWSESKTALDAHLADDDGTTGDLWYDQVGMRTGWFRRHEWGALHAFLPAVLALGGDLPRAERLQRSNLAMWNRYGIEPDGFDHRTGKVLGARYPLRPEIVESAYVLFRLTRDPAYQAMGRTFLDGIDARCRTPGGYTVLDSVVTGRQGDLMPSYFLAETLKYLYLLFAPDATLDFEHVVLNTEAHPLRRTW